MWGQGGKRSFFYWEKMMALSEGDNVPCAYRSLCKYGDGNKKDIACTAKTALQCGEYHFKEAQKKEELLRLVVMIREELKN